MERKLSQYGLYNFKPRKGSNSQKQVELTIKADQNGGACQNLWATLAPLWGCGSS